MKQLYVYVDESGQDPLSEIFAVVAIVNTGNQEKIRQQLLAVEEVAGTHGLKWHKSKHERRMRYLSLVMDRRIAAGGVYIASYRKPIPHFFPLLDVLERAIKDAARGEYRARIYVDGIDAYKARKLTNALRAKAIVLGTIKGRRDESEPCIRLADMWAGCVRSAALRHADTAALLERARESGYVRDVSPS